MIAAVRWWWSTALLVVLLGGTGCSSPPDGGGGVDAASVADASVVDAAVVDAAAAVDAATADASATDASSLDASVHDAPPHDAPPHDAPLLDAPLDAPAVDAPTLDASIDAWSADAGVPDARPDGGIIVPGACVAEVSVGRHICARTGAGGVRCWGGSGTLGGELGYGGGYQTYPIGLDNRPADAGDVPLPGMVEQVSAGPDHTCAVLVGGNVACWGAGGQGQLGYASTATVGANNVVTTTVVLGGAATMVGVGQEHSCALMNTGAVRCWGRSNYGQLGYGDIESIGDDEHPQVAGEVQLGGTAVQIAVGGAHTCALLDTGAVRCWGRGGDGRLGYADFQDIGDDETPASVGNVDVGGVVTQITAGGSHTCALLDTGAVRCWGSGALGQLGYASQQNVGDNETPASRGDVSVGVLVAAVDAGAAHTCVLTSAAGVRCWGSGADGALGYGNTLTIGDDELPSTQGDVSLGETAVAVSAGSWKTCALLSSGALRCWGEGSFGAFGTFNHEDIGDDELPSSAPSTPVCASDPPPGTSIAVDVEAGGEHTCVRSSLGTVRCWGYNYAGQLGYGHTNDIGDDELPATAGDVNVGGTVVQLALGRTHSCALLDDKSVRCWGSAAFGRLGYGNTRPIGDNETPASAGAVDVGGPVEQLAAGTLHTCALLTGGGVRCWGIGTDGRLGYGSTVSIGDNETPASMGNILLGGAAQQVVAGDRHTCALMTTGAVRCWGYGPRLGYPNGPSIGDDEPPAVAGDVVLGGLAQRLTAAGEHTCAHLASGAVTCWGRNNAGQLGYGNTTDIGDNEDPAAAGVVPVGGVVARIEAGGPLQGPGTTIAVLDNGNVVSWGNGDVGQDGRPFSWNVGDDETPASAPPIDIGGSILDIAVGAKHACAVLSGGAVRCWGDSEFGRLGYASSRLIGNNETPASVGDVSVY